MKNILYILLISCFSLIIVSCGSESRMLNSTSKTNTTVDKTTRDQAVIDCYLLINTTNDNSSVDNSTVFDSIVSSARIKLSDSGSLVE